MFLVLRLEVVTVTLESGYSGDFSTQVKLQGEWQTLVRGNEVSISKKVPSSQALASALLMFPGHGKSALVICGD